jgi:hypothetical protein
MRKTMFQMGLPSSTVPWQGGTFAGIPVYDGQKDNVDRESILQRLPVPPGVTVQYPYMVKVSGEGEYWVKSDGTTEYYSYKYGRWEPATPTKKDIWYQMTHLD